ncbi:penicillin acylase family protein [soil metagenome]
MKNYSYRPLVVIFLLSIAAIGQTVMPRTVLTGLKGEVTVRRDQRSVPYIEAVSDADLYFAQGYVTASDRLWQMDLLRRVARGETAEIFGSSVIEEDKRWRRFGFASIAEESLKELTPDLRAALENYARGVNAYVATLDEKTLPVEFQILQFRPRDWTPADTVVVGKILADALSTTWRNDLMRASIQSLSPDKIADLTNQVTPYDVVLFGKDTPQPRRGAAASHPTVSPEIMALADRDVQARADSLARVGLYSEGLAASNNWVISGKRTADGTPILANDPHLAPAAPGIWYLSHLSTPTMRVSGVTFPGVPGIVLGHNDHIAWGATNVGPDVQDLYHEIFNDAGEYKTPTGWQKTSVRKEQIKVRSNPAKPDTTTVEYEVTETRNGVIVIEDGGKKYALKWTARDPKNSEFESFFAANRAKNWEDFKSALRKYGGATQNFVYADVKGNIGWYAAGRVPIRKSGDGSLPYDGASSDGEWTGFIPFEKLPNLYNPSDGLIITANQRIVGTSYEYTQMSRDAASPWRARRIYDLLNAKTKITMDDVSDVQMDHFNIPLANLAKEIMKFGTASTETNVVLKAWDGKMSPEASGAVLVNEIRVCIANKMAEGNKPAPAFLIRERITDWAVRERSARWLPAGYANYGDLIRACDTQSRSALADPKRYGPDPAGWVWGKTWQSRFPHPLASVPFVGAQFAVKAVPINGSGQSPNVGSAVSMRFIASPGNWDSTRHVIPLGQSGDPRSKHYKDQFEAWASGTPAIFPFTKAAVAKAAPDVVILAPR